MTALVRAELLKLRTARSTIVLLGFIAVLGLLSLARVLQAAGRAGGPVPGTADAWTDVIGAALAPTLLVVLVGALAFTGEVRHGSLTPTLLVTPRRGSVVAAKMLASVLVGVTATATLATAAAVAGAGTGVLTTAPDLGALRLLGAGLLLAAFWSSVGVAVGVLVRHQIPALVLPLVWVLVAETLVTAYGFGAVRWWLPGGAGAGLAGSDSPGVLPGWLAALVLTGYAVALTVPGLIRLRRVDIT
jgi:hypothetical protein